MAKLTNFQKKVSEWTMDHGNRCGHSPTGSTLSVARGLQIEGKGAQPKLLQTACDIIDSLFYVPTKFLQSLFFRNNRKIRSELREAICKVLKTLMKFVDLATCRIAVPNEHGSLQNITLGVLAQHAGLTLDRCTRAWNHLKQAGIVRTQRCFEVVNGEKKGLASIKWLSPDFFDAIGLTKWFQNDRKKRVQLAKTRRYRAELKKNKKKMSKPAQAEQKMKLTAVLSSIFKKKNGHQSTQKKSNPMTDYDEYNRQVKVEACRLYQETGISISECYEIALQRIKRH